MSEPPEQGLVEEEQIFLIPIDKLFIGDVNVRKFRDPVTITNLKNSIREKKRITDPLQVVPRQNEMYEIIVGSRRYTAAKELLDELKPENDWLKKGLPCIIRELSEVEAYRDSVIENIQHEHLEPCEEAWTYDRQMRLFPLVYPTKEVLAKSLGILVQRIYRVLPLTMLVESVGVRVRKDIQNSNDRVERKFLTLEHGLLIARLFQEPRIREKTTEMDIGKLQTKLADNIFELDLKHAKVAVDEFRAELLGEKVHKKESNNKKTSPKKSASKIQTRFTITLSDKESEELVEIAGKAKSTPDRVVSQYVRSGIKESMSVGRN